MRIAALALLVAAAVAAGCGSDESPAHNQLAQLIVRVDADGPRGPSPARVLRLTCHGPEQGPACGAAAGVSDADLAPTPPDRACTQIYGGPETARISGTLRGERIDATYSRINGCEIARWDRVQELLSAVR
jgi:hypothetical protein